MKKNIITLLVIIALVSAPATAAVWVKQSSGGGDSSKACYLVKFNTVSYGAKQLIGTGVVSGSTFTGFLKYTSNPQNNATTRLYKCTNDRDCAWFNAYSYSGSDSYGYNSYVVSVSGLPITSAQAVACY